MELITLVAFSTAFVCHVLINKTFVANTVASLSATFITWLLASSEFGWLDFTFLKNISLTLGVSVAISVLVGLVFFNQKNGCKVKTNSIDKPDD